MSEEKQTELELVTDEMPVTDEMLSIAKEADVKPQYSEEQIAQAKEAAAELVAIAELTSKHGLTKEMIDNAVEVERSISDPANKIGTVVQAMDLMKSHDLQPSQLMFLAINAKSGANVLQATVNHFKAKLDETMGVLEKVMLEKASENKINTDL